MRQQLLRIARLVVAVILGLSLVLGTACSNTPKQPEGTASAIVSSTPTPDRIATGPPPLKVVVIADQSRSANWTKTPIVTTEDLQILIAALLERGGELACGLIRDYSNKGLVRLRIVLPQTGPSAPEPENKNPFKNAQDRQASEAAKAKREKLLADWRQATDARIQAFLVAVEPLLSQKADARRTDVWGAVSRANLFLSEPDMEWSQPPLKFTCLISDGIHTATSRPVAPNQDSTLILVNGSASVGKLAQTKLVRFESAQAAFRFITTAKGGQ